MRQVHLWFASVFGIGYFPWASGTAASAAALVPYFLLRNDALLYAGVICALFFLGVVSAGAAEAILREKDSHKIVIDEVVGYLIAAAFLPHHIFYPVAAFFLFRLFDIWKPGWIRKSQDLAGGWGVMLDDVLAGVAANVLLQVARLFLPV